MWLSGSKPSKLCHYICKALRGNNGQNLKTEEGFEEVDYTRMADSSTHRQSRCTCLCYYNHFVQSHLKKKEQINLLVSGENKKRIKKWCRLLHSKNGAQLRHLKLKYYHKGETERKNIYKYTKKFVVFSWLYFQKPPLLEEVAWEELPFYSPHTTSDLEILRQFKAINIFFL